MANSDIRDKSILEKARIIFMDHFTCNTKICTTYLQQNWYIVSSFSLDVNTYVPEALMQKNIMAIIGNGMRIKQE